MRNWLLTFRPDTYEKVKAHQTIGVLKNHRMRFAEFTPGDRFVAYITQQRCFDSHGLIDGKPFEDCSPIFGEGQLYPQRCRVKFNQTGAAAAAGDTLWFLDVFKDLDNTEPTNLIRCKGGFIEVSDRDYDYLRGLMSGAEKPQVLAWRNS